jgi:predicted proteasome-type protease
MKNSINVKALTIKIKKELFRAQRQATRSVNKEMLGLFWSIGKMISDSTKRRIHRLSVELEKDFPNNLIFSQSNLEDMRKFFLTYPQGSNVQPSVAQMPWAQHRLLLQKRKYGKRSNPKTTR